MIRALDFERSLRQRAQLAMFVRLVLAVPLTALACGAFAAQSDSTLATDRFGDVAVYAPDGAPSSVALLVSGHDGWTGPVIDMAKNMRDWSALVAGIDGARYLESLRGRSDCVDPAADLLGLARALEHSTGIAAHPPIVVGYQTGGALAYAAAVRASPGALAAAISIAFCPSLPTAAHWCGAEAPFAAAAGGITALHAVPRLARPWVVLQGLIDRDCSVESVRAFTAQVADSKLVVMPKVGHDFGNADDWLLHLRDAYVKVVTETTEAGVTAGDVADLPLTEVPAAHDRSDRFALLLTGDGGWVGLDKDVSARLANAGIPVVAMSSLRYFWSRRTPEATARDIERVIRHYVAAWQKEHVILIGFSFGADVLPAVINALPGAVRARIATLNLLSLAKEVSFEVHVADWLPGSQPKGRPIAPEFTGLAGIRTLCIYGTEEADDSLCPRLPPTAVRALGLPGGHHFNDDAATLVKHIIEFAGP